MTISRRAFLKSSTLALATGPLVVPHTVFGANEMMQVGIVGLGIRGLHSHLPEFSKLPNVRVVAVVDPDRARTATATTWLADKGYMHKVDRYEDMREMFDRKDIQAVTVATMNYWHGLATIWACEAGKHVFCEKPLSHFIHEGRQMVNAARKYKRILQHGTQLRSFRSVIDSIEWLKAGNLGAVKCITAFANKPRKTIGKRKEPLPLPKDFNYDLWCGPAQDGPLFRDRLQYDCSFTWNMGDGESLNQGVHQIDIARWILGSDEMPRRTISLGGRFTFNDVGDVPNTQIVYYDFPKFPILYEVHNLCESKDSKKPDNFRGFNTGIVADCEDGSLYISHSTTCVAYDKDRKEIKRWNEGGNIFGNFIDAIRKDAPETLLADGLLGHISNRIGHVGNISYRLGERASASEQKKAIEDYPYMIEMHERYLKHLEKHEIDASETILGPWLECDTEKEIVKGDHTKANELVRGTYRAPYLLPDM